MDREHFLQQVEHLRDPRAEHPNHCRCPRHEPNAHIARALEAHYRACLAPHVARLAHHFCAAGQMDEAGKATAYAMQAGARAIAMLAYEEAVRYYEMALQLVERREP